MGEEGAVPVCAGMGGRWEGGQMVGGSYQRGGARVCRHQGSRQSVVVGTGSGGKG